MLVFVPFWKFIIKVKKYVQRVFEDMERSKRNIVTVEKSKNVRWKVNVDLRISYTNV